MKYLTPEIEALSKINNSKSLVKSSISCGIFQDCNDTEAHPKLYHRIRPSNYRLLFSRKASGSN